jgi:hypothetical protein
MIILLVVLLCASIVIVASWQVARWATRSNAALLEEPELDRCSCGDWKLKDKPLCTLCMMDMHHHE